MVGLVLTLGISTVLAGGKDDKPKPPKDSGTLSIRTTEQSYPVRVDGKEVGMTGVGTPAEFYLAPGFHTVEVQGPYGKVWKDEIEIRKGQKNCVCLKIVTETLTTPCPYRFHLEGPVSVTEGDLITFAAVNSGTAPIPIRYAWKVNNGRLTSGVGTPSVTVDTTGMGKGTVTAELDVNDDTYDGKCRQVISVPTDVIPPNIETPKSYRCDEFAAKNRDQDKAQFDNCVIQLQNTPDGQAYIIIYEGTDKKNPYNKLSKFTLDYWTNTRKVDPRFVQVVKGSDRAKSSYEIWIVPPGAKPPVVQ